MSESSSEFKSVPEKVVLAGDGLRKMELSHFNTLVRNLGRMGITVSPAENVNQAGIREGGLDLEDEAKDIPLYESDFKRYAATHGINKSLAIKAFRNLTRPWAYYHTALKMKQEGGSLNAFQENSLANFYEWQDKLCINDGTVSLNGLRQALDRGMVEEINDIGEKTLPLLKNIVEEFETKLKQPISE